MKNRDYTSFEEIELDLKLLSLERKISIEELKSLKYDIREDLQEFSWLRTGLKLFKNFGGILLIKKIFK